MILTQQLLKQNITSTLFKTLFFTFLPVPFSSSYIPSTPSHLPSSLWPLTLCTTNISAVYHIRSLHNSFLCTALLNHRLSSVSSSGCQTLKDIKTHVLSHSSPSRSLRLAAVNLSKLLTVLSAVYIGCFWFAQAEF